VEELVFIELHLDRLPGRDHRNARAAIVRE
jgi:hypothetical protein